jgi:RNA polymerase sigma-70 factor (ECF subfamily)
MKLLAEIQCKPASPRIGLNVRMERALSSEVAPVTEGSGGRLDDFETLVEQHRPRIFRFILASLRNQQSAENLTQDCFVRAYQARDQFRGASSAATWLMQIAANLIRSHEASSRLKFWRRTLRADVDLSDAGDWIPDRKMSPEQMAAAKQQVGQIWKAAGRLSGKQRTVFLLRFVEDMELLEIAAVTGMKEGTVKTHLFRALKLVRAALERKMK